MTEDGVYLEEQSLKFYANLTSFSCEIRLEDKSIITLDSHSAITYTGTIYLKRFSQKRFKKVV